VPRERRKQVDPHTDQPLGPLLRSLSQWHRDGEPMGLPRLIQILHRTSCLTQKMRIPWIPLFAEIGSPGKNLQTTREARDFREIA